jgi:hypothetical protein
MPLIKLNDDQYKRLCEALKAAFRNRGDLSSLLLAIDQNLDLLEVPSFSFEQNLEVVIKNAEARDWLLPLVAKAHERRPREPVLQQLIDELTVLAPPSSISAFEACRLSGGFILIDRAGLRDSLEVLSRPLGKRILVVTGGDRTGKSHSVQLISHLNQIRGEFQLVRIDLEAEQQIIGNDRLIEPIDLATRLVKKLQYEIEIPKPPKDAQWASWVAEFCENFEPKAMDDPQRRWIIIDAFNKVSVKQPTFDLVKELARRITRLPKYRLILLGYRESMHPEVHPTMEVEDINPIGKRQLAEFFAVAFQQDRISADAQRLAVAVRRVLKGLDPKDADYLPTVGQRASEELAKAMSGAAPWAPPATSRAFGS